ncbi:sugar-binding transcriptional regulator [Bosea lathyri]|nr:sugar-binding domain-containing protein [Bosea lathyri]
MLKSKAQPAACDDVPTHQRHLGVVMELAMARKPRDEAGSVRKQDSRSAARTIQLLEVARRFYLDTESKVVIAKRLGISRFTVSRLLEQARSSGLVRIDIRPPADVDFALSSALMRKTSLKRAIVLPSVDPGSELGLLADAAASYLVEVGVSEDVLGLVAGRTTSLILDRIEELTACSIVQLSGVSRASYFEHSPAETIRAMAMRFRGQTYPIYAPLLLDDAALVASLREQIGIADSVAQFPRLTRVLFSVGAWKDGGSGLYESLDQAGRDNAAKAGAVAEILGHLLDASGRRICQSLSDRCLTIPFDCLNAVADRVAVGGSARAQAVLACVRAGAATTLVTDSRTAEFVLAELG